MENLPIFTITKKDQIESSFESESFYSSDSSEEEDADPVGQLLEKKAVNPNKKITPINILKAQGKQRRQVIFEVPSSSEREASNLTTPKVIQTPATTSVKISEEREKEEEDVTTNVTDMKLLEEAKELVVNDLMEDAVTEYEISSQMVHFLLNRKLKFLIEKRKRENQSSS